MMHITINGETKELEQACTLAQLLMELELADRPVAVEVNRELVSRKDHANHQLQDGDQLEVVTLVGGG